MRHPLLLSKVIEHAESQFGNVEIVSICDGDDRFSYTFGDCATRSRQLANSLRNLGLLIGDCVASIAWNSHRHLEAYFAVSGSGMVMHTCNPRLPTSQLAYVLNHAGSRVVLFDTDFLDLVRALAPLCPNVIAWVCLCPPAELPACEGLCGYTSYEALIALEDQVFVWPELNEELPAALCYTSGTTGNPKGVLYSHRAISLVALSACLPDVTCLSSDDSLLPAVPMFHINAWCLPYSAMMVGARLVLPGPRLDGESLCGLIAQESVTVSVGVPTVWSNLLQFVESHDASLSSLKRIVVGGAAMPRPLIAKLLDRYKIDVRHGWGMTETTGPATITVLSSAQRQLPVQEQAQLLSRQGRSLFGINLKVVDESGRLLPRDGNSQGELMVKGHWIMDRYHKTDESALQGGWLPTGDIATIDLDGYMQIRDRAKDLIKSGGEWISSQSLEQAAMEHASVLLAAVIGVPHSKWDERPLMYVKCKPEHALCKSELLTALSKALPRWWLPDDIRFVTELPIGGTGKVLKGRLREMYAEEQSRMVQS